MGVYERDVVVVVESTLGFIVELGLCPSRGTGGDVCRKVFFCEDKNGKLVLGPTNCVAAGFGVLAFYV